MHTRSISFSKIERNTLLIENSNNTNNLLYASYIFKGIARSILCAETSAFDDCLASVNTLKVELQKWFENKILVALLIDFTCLFDLNSQVFELSEQRIVIAHEAACKAYKSKDSDAI